jgi:hypothetical protein
VAARQQAILSERRPGIYPGERRPVVHLVIGEAALVQQVGSKQLMDEQLRVLTRAAEESETVTVQVLPFDSGAHAGAADGSVEILRFDPAAGLSLVHIGGIGGGASLDGDDVLVAYADAFDQLRAFALTSDQSAGLLDSLARG